MEICHIASIQALLAIKALLKTIITINNKKIKLIHTIYLKKRNNMLITNIKVNKKNLVFQSQFVLIQNKEEGIVKRVVVV